MSLSLLRLVSSRVNSMDLKLKDVAELLNVSETTIRRWMTESKIPYYRMNNQFCFSRSEIESWVLSCKQDQGKFSPFAASDSFANNNERLNTQSVWPFPRDSSRRRLVRCAGKYKRRGDSYIDESHRQRSAVSMPKC